MNAVSGASIAPSATPTAIASRHDATRRAVALWLLLCCVLVFAMVVVGGVTRLTHSGLSITEWQPIVGSIPPRNDAQWQETFAKYQATPEYRLVNRDMTLSAFKGIFWWEYAHRLLGRAIGFVFLVPFVWFAARRRIARGDAWKLLGVFALGGLQGAMGWYMVQSGLVDDPRVSPLRLTAHLGIAILIIAAMLWMALDRIDPERARLDAPAQRTTRRLAFAVVGVVFAMILAGGLVAGIRAGLAYNTFPLMNGHFIPPETFVLDPWWRNFVYNMATVQFDHRLLGWLLAALVPLSWAMLARTPGVPARARIGGHVLLALAAMQIALGIATVLHAAPLPLAAAHQAGAVLVFAAALNVAHALR